MSKKIVIIGAHAAGIDAASAARKIDRKSEITLITKEKHPGYSRCGLPFVIGGHIPSFEKLIVFQKAYFRMMKLDLKTELTVTEIKSEEKIVKTLDKTGKYEDVKYDKLIITTGATPFTPPIKGINKEEGVVTLRSLEDGVKIDQIIKGGVEKAVIMGAGLIGLEMAVALHERGIKTKVFELQPQILPVMLDFEMAKIVQSTLQQKGIDIEINKIVEEILGSSKVKGIIAGGEKYETDLFVNACGVRANTQIAAKAGITLGETKGIKTNKRMETEVEDIYAAGDCAETFNIVTNEPTCPQLGTVAVRQGKIAGINSAGGYALFTGVLNSVVTRLFDTVIGATGLTENTAKKTRIETISGSITSKTKADYYPGGTPIKVKIIVEKESERIIGSQIIGGEEVTQRINAISFAIQKHMTISELAKADTAYAPPVCETWEPMVLAAELILMKLRRK